MLFSSLEFLFLYIVVTLLIYFLVPLRARNVVLLAFSLLFYGWGERVYVWLMVFTILIDYAAGLLVARARARERARAARRWLIAAVAINLALLGFFKYADFVLDNLRRIPALGDLPTLGLALPIGISFYTFQALSYVIDVYRGEVAAQRSVIRFGTYVTLFPQLIAGPIVRYRDVAAQLAHRTHSLSAAASGARTFACGLAKKVLLANTAGAMWESFRVIPDAERTVAGAWLGILFFTLQIYFDFSGYSDMAIGIGRVLGFRFAENFYYPYVSRSITDFWRRWHISLSTWFREYVYIPLGGNRCAPARMVCNLLVTWLLTGLWHGASWNYVLWGLYFLAFLLIEKFVLKLSREAHGWRLWLRRAYALVVVYFGWFLFRFEDMGLLGTAMKNLFGGSPAGFFDTAATMAWKNNCFFLIFAMLATLPLAPFLGRKLSALGANVRGFVRVNSVLSTVLPPLLVFVSLLALVGNSYNPFLYFQF